MEWISYHQSHVLSFGGHHRNNPTFLIYFISLDNSPISPEDFAFKSKYLQKILHSKVNSMLSTIDIDPISNFAGGF